MAEYVPTVGERRAGARAIQIALNQCGIVVRYAIAGPSELFDVASVLLKSDFMAAHDAAVRADMQREVRTVEELDALPVGSVVLGRGERPWQKFDSQGGIVPLYHQWMCPDGGFVRHGNSADLLLPAQILFTPSTPNQQGAES